MGILSLGYEFAHCFVVVDDAEINGQCQGVRVRVIYIWKVDVLEIVSCIQLRFPVSNVKWDVPAYIIILHKRLDAVLSADLNIVLPCMKTSRRS